MTAADRLGEPVPIPPHVDPAVWVRFAAQVVMIPGRCHLWTGRPRDDGYGQFWAPAQAIRTAEPGPALFDAPTPEAAEQPAQRPRVWRAHRFAWSALVGPLAETDHLMHQCDEPLCVPITAEHLAAHLTRGDNAANVGDRERRGRGTRRGRYGLPVPSRADKRGQAARSLALHQALTQALDAGTGRADLPAIVAAVAAAGDPFADQLALDFPAQQESR